MLSFSFMGRATPPLPPLSHTRSVSHTRRNCDSLSLSFSHVLFEPEAQRGAQS